MRQPTPRQRKAAQAVVENLQSSKPLDTGVVLANVGYGTIVQDPKRITSSIGFKQALAEMGLTEELVTTSLVEDIKAKPKSRTSELKLAADILGMVKREPETPPESTINTYNFIFNETTREEIKEFEDKLKAKLLNKHV